MFSEQAYPVECGNSLYFCKKVSTLTKKVSLSIYCVPQKYRLSIEHIIVYRVFSLQCHINGV